jgi:LacI family transcriptional regulator
MTERRRPTMRDVAREAGVSLKTVSRVVNEEPGVTAALTDRVSAAVRRLGYQPDDRARFLRRTETSSKSLGFVQMDVANPFFSAIFRGLEDVARAEGHLVLAGSSDGDPGREEALVKAFIARRVDGLILVSCHPDLGFLAAETQLGTPVVFLDHRPAADLGDVIRTDHYGGAAAATRHLLDHGHRDIAFLGDSTAFFSAAERRRGFCDVMAEAGPDTPWLHSGLTGPADAEARTEALLAGEHRPTALFTAQNYVTIGAMRALHRLGLQHDVALVGFDDVEFSELVEPRISVVLQEPRTLGRLAGERIYARLAGDRTPARSTILPASVLARGSGEIRPA